MVSLNKIAEKVEKYTIYAFLGIFFILQLISLFIESSIVDKLINKEKISMIFMVFFLFYIIMLIDRRIPLIRKNKGISHFPDLTKALNNLISETRNITSIDIFAHSSDSIYPLVEARVNKSASIRVILRDPLSPDFISHIKEKPSLIEAEKAKIRNNVIIWKHLFEDKENVELYHYKFEPSYLLIIINKDTALLGILIPMKIGWGYKIRETMIFDRNTDDSSYFVSDLIDWFNSIINEKCEKISIS